MPERPQACDRCGGTGVVAFGDRALGPNHLVTFYSFACPCGARLESDDHGPLEGEWREQELREGGTWSLLADATEHARCAQLLRPFLRVTAREALESVRRGLTGTHEEMQCCAYVLRQADLAAGIAVVVEGTRPRA